MVEEINSHHNSVLTKCQWLIIFHKMFWSREHSLSVTVLHQTRFKQTISSKAFGSSPSFAPHCSSLSSIYISKIGAQLQRKWDVASWNSIWKLFYMQWVVISILNSMAVIVAGDIGIEVIDYSFFNIRSVKLSCDDLWREFKFSCDDLWREFLVLVWTQMYHSLHRGYVQLFAVLHHSQHLVQCHS